MLAPNSRFQTDFSGGRYRIRTRVLGLEGQGDIQTTLIARVPSAWPSLHEGCVSKSQINSPTLTLIQRRKFCDALIYGGQVGGVFTMKRGSRAWKKLGNQRWKWRKKKLRRRMRARRRQKQ